MGNKSRLETRKGSQARGIERFVPPTVASQPLICAAYARVRRKESSGSISRTQRVAFGANVCNATCTISWSNGSKVFPFSNWCAASSVSCTPRNVERNERLSIREDRHRGNIRFKQAPARLRPRVSNNSARTEWCTEPY